VLVCGLGLVNELFTDFCVLMNFYVIIPGTADFPTKPAACVPRI